MSPDQAVDVTTVIWALAAVPSLGIAVAQAILLVRLRKRADRLWQYRVMGSLLFGSLGVAMSRNVVVWADLAYFDQHYLGPIARRWPLDLGLALCIMVACLWAGVLYVREQREAPQT